MMLRSNAHCLSLLWIAVVFFERNTKLGDSAFLQTLEPRLFYLYIPKEGQDRIPLFDTSEYDFNFFQLFRGKPV